MIYLIKSGKKMKYTKIAGIFPIIIGCFSLLSVFLLSFGGITIDASGLFGWEIKFSFSPLGVIDRDWTGILSPLVGPIYELFLNFMYPSIETDALLTVASWTTFLGAFFLVILGIIELKKSESIAIPVIISVIAFVLLILVPIYARIRFDYFYIQKYDVSFTTTKLLINEYFDLPIHIPTQWGRVSSIGLYLTFGSQIITMSTCLAAIIINAINKKKRRES